jgi:hypothetical protein
MWKVQKMAESEFVPFNLGGRLEGPGAADRKIASGVRDLGLVVQETVTILACSETGGAQLRSGFGLRRETTSLTYGGSATTPRCSDGVTWFVLKTPAEALWLR